MKVNIAALVEAEMHKAMMSYRRFLSLYGFWFVLYGDSDSDEIMSDIHEQAKSWAYAQIAARTTA
jgi:hypothetical protein